MTRSLDITRAAMQDAMERVYTFDEFEPQAELTRPSVQSLLDRTSFAGTEGDEGQQPNYGLAGPAYARDDDAANTKPAINSNSACLTSRQADEGGSNPQHPRAAPLYTSPEAPFHSITDWEDEDQ